MPGEQRLVRLPAPCGKADERRRCLVCVCCELSACWSSNREMQLLNRIGAAQAFLMKSCLCWNESLRFCLLHCCGVPDVVRSDLEFTFINVQGFFSCYPCGLEGTC